MLINTFNSSCLFEELDDRLCGGVFDAKFVAGLPNCVVAICNEIN